MNKTTETKALREVREWKAACNREVAGMETGEAVGKRLKDAEKNARRAGFVPIEQLVESVAEVGGGYGCVGRDRNPDWTDTRKRRGQPRNAGSISP